ncbi:ABC transporter substrate-binding protein [Neobacillus vireti]|uniref:ABC transporter substrate-binding protein n=1 Tax=Neobacillus vireti TaxID=220686 RepID=UPI002FFDFF5A
MKKKFASPRKLISAMLIFLIVSSLALTGCSSKSSSGETKTADGKTKFTMWTFVQVHADYWKDAAKTWNKNHPKQQIDLKINVFPYDQMNQKLQVALNSGNGAPDIADVEIGQFAKYTKTNNPPFEDITKEVEPFVPNLVKSRTDNYTVDGKVYGLDYHVGTTLVYYNMDIMNKAGIDPATIKTWDDYIKAGKIVKEKTGKYMTSVETSSSFVFDAMVAQQHSDMVKDGKSSLDTPENVKALQTLQDMIYKDKIAKQAEGGQQDNEEYYAAFNKGEYASVVMPAWYMSRMVGFMPKLTGKIHVTGLPVFKDGDLRSAGLGGTATVVTNQAHDKTLAKKFVVESKAGEEGSIKTWTILGFDPIRSDVWTSEELAKPNKYTEYFGTDIFKQMAALKDEVGGMSFTNNSFPIIADELLTNGLPKIMKKQASVEDTLKTVDAAADKRIAAGK